MKYGVELLMKHGIFQQHLIRDESGQPVKFDCFNTVERFVKEHSKQNPQHAVVIKKLK